MLSALHPAKHSSGHQTSKKHLPTDHCLEHIFEQPFQQTQQNTVLQKELFSVRH